MYTECLQKRRASTSISTPFNCYSSDRWQVSHNLFATLAAFPRRHPGCCKRGRKGAIHRVGWNTQYRSRQASRPSWLHPGIAKRRAVPRYQSAFWRAHPIPARPSEVSAPASRCVKRCCPTRSLSITRCLALLHRYWGWEENHLRTFARKERDPDVSRRRQKGWPARTNLSSWAVAIQSVLFVHTRTPILVGQEGTSAFQLHRSQHLQSAHS